jgi:CHAD domain-containing protein
MRVGLRRLRAAISLFGDILPVASTARIKSELKWLTGELAAAREIDVFVEEKIRPLKGDAAPMRGVRAIEEQFKGRLDEAFERASNALATPRYRGLSIDVLEWLETRKPRSKRTADVPIGKFAEEIMLRRLKKIRKEGRFLDGMAPPQRHKLRIKIKKMRYAVEFFRSLYPRPSLRRLDDLSDILKKAQDDLGALNDFVAHRAMGTDAALKAPRKHRRARAFAAGIVVGQERETSKTLLKNASRAIARLKPSRVRLI